jgi:hypothetical protein
MSMMKLLGGSSSILFQAAIPLLIWQRPILAAIPLLIWQRPILENQLLYGSPRGVSVYIS